MGSICAETNLVDFSWFGKSSTNTMNVEKLKQLQAQVRIGGKGTARRKKKVVHRTATTDDKKLQSSLKKLSVNNIPGIEEVNMIKDDGTVIHFNNPKVQASLAANTFAVTGHGESKQITDLLPGILNQLGAESLTHLKKLASNVPTADGADDAGNDADDDDDVPDLVENFDEASKNEAKESEVEKVEEVVEKVEEVVEKVEEVVDKVEEVVEKVEDLKVEEVVDEIALKVKEASEKADKNFENNFDELMDLDGITMESDDEEEEEQASSQKVEKAAEKAEEAADKETKAE